jgi:hypothetical protein
MRGFTAIRLLLTIVAVNTIMFLMLMTSMTSSSPWLARVLPGQFGTGGQTSGYWVFFALVLLVNSVTVLIAGFVLVLPALRDGSTSDETRLARHLVDRGGVSEHAKDAVLLALRQDALASHGQIVVGRAILVAGLLFLVASFASVTLSVAHALPNDSMFVSARSPVQNSTITPEGVVRFTADQILGSILQNAPRLYNFEFGQLRNNTANVLFSHFVFVFRISVLLVTLLIFVAFLRRGAAPPKPKKAADVVAEAQAAADSK